MDSALGTPIAGEEEDQVLWLLHDQPKLCVDKEKSKKGSSSGVFIPLGDFATPKAIDVKGSEWSGFWLIGGGTHVVIGMPSARAREICLRCLEKVIGALNKLHGKMKEDASSGSMNGDGFSEQMEAVLFKANPLLSMGGRGGSYRDALSGSGG